MVLSQKPFKSRFSCLLSDKALAKIKEICLRQVLTVDRLSIMFRSNGKREFVPRDQVYPINCRLLFIFYTQISSFT